MAGSFQAQAQACVLGDMNLVRPLGLAGIRCVVVARPGAAIRFSRFARSVIEWAGDWDDGSGLAEHLVHYAGSQAEPPVLFYQHDEHALFVSKHRELLGDALRFVIAPPAQLLDVLDKVRFQALAGRLGLPVPTAEILTPGESAEPPDGLRYPVILKPPTRANGRWLQIDPRRKATRVEDRAGLCALWPALATLGVPIVAQQIVPGPETRIESYHVYVDASGQIAGEFTGRKIRTRPREYGQTTALEITTTRDVAKLGRAIIQQVGLRGVAKLDFKRDPDGRLWLLEINPRFNLWHYPGAVAGVNLPALVWADLCGRPRPHAGPVQPGVRWCSVRDRRAAREWAVPRGRWLRWALRCETKSNLAWDDPLPIARRALQCVIRAL